MVTHEIPTHLEVEDKLVFGLAARQAVALGLGLCLGYVLYQQALVHLPGGHHWVLPLALRIGLGALCAGMGTVIAFVRPLGRPLEAWLVVVVRYRALPKHYRWQPARVRPDALDATALAALSHPPRGPDAGGEGAVTTSPWAGRLVSTYEEVYAGE